MSNPEHSADPGEREPLVRLEEAVQRAVRRIDGLEVRLREARERASELEELLRSFQTGDEEPAEMKARLEAVEAANADMRDRLARGRDAVERLLARIRFLEEQR